MIRQFSKVSLSSVQSTAAQLWDDPQSHIQWHMGGTKAYCSRLFGLFLLNSLTPTFAATLHSRIDQKYSSDGPLLLVTMCNHVHRNHLAFVESVKHKLRTTTLQDHNNDVPKYLQFLQDNTHLQVTKTQHITTFFRICSCSLDPPPIHYFSEQFWNGNAATWKIALSSLLLSSSPWRTMNAKSWSTQTSGSRQ